MSRLMEIMQVNKMRASKKRGGLVGVFSKINDRVREEAELRRAKKLKERKTVRMTVSRGGPNTFVHDKLA